MSLYTIELVALLKPVFPPLKETLIFQKTHFWFFRNRFSVVFPFSLTPCYFSFDVILYNPLTRLQNRFGVQVAWFFKE